MMLYSEKMWMWSEVAILLHKEWFMIQFDQFISRRWSQSTTAIILHGLNVIEHTTA